MKKSSVRIVAACTGIFFSALIASRAQTPEAVTPKSVLDVMQRVADWQLANPSKHKTTDWTQGAGDAGFMALAGISGDAKYRDAMLAVGETNEWKLGPRKFHADDHAVGQTYAELYFLWRDPKMIAPLRERFDVILAEPSKVESLAFNQPKGIAGENWSWCDSLFMAPPAWVRLYAATGEEKYLNFAVKEWWRTTDYLYDKDEHLFFRDSTYFKKTEANGKKVFWGRGNGWVIAGLVRTLQFLPMNHPDRPRFEKLFKEMAAKILTCQQPDGLWRASLLDPESYPLKETSGSGFYTYALAWGVNQGLLDKAQFEPAVRKAWAALVACVAADGKLTHVQPIGADPKKFDEGATEVYGVGAFLLAGSEVYRMAVVETSLGRTTHTLIIFEDAPITLVISNLAKVCGLDGMYTFDPKLGYQNSSQEPDVSFHGEKWKYYTSEKAFYTLLDNYNLEADILPESGTLLITKKKKNHQMPQFASGVYPMFSINVKNYSGFSRDCETIERPLDDDATNYVVMDGNSSRILDSQIYTEPMPNDFSEPKSSAHIDMETGKLSVTSPTKQKAQTKILFQSDFAPNETKTFYILDASALAATPPPIVKTFARFVPERFDDFAWESDRIAHRIYGLALIKAEGTISSGADVWIKKDRRLILDEMYATKHYHEDNGSFMDDYRVGKSRGCGGLGIWDGKKLAVSSNWQKWKVITTGPIRSEFELTYDAWDAGNGRMVSEVKRFSIDAGSWMTKVSSTILSEDKSPLTIGVGFAERACPTNREEFISNDLTEGWMTYWQPEDVPKGTTAVAILLPRNFVKEFTNDNPSMPDSVKHANVPQPTHEGYPPIRTQLAVTQTEIGKPFEYYFGACWDRSGDFTNHLQWENYLKRFAERRDTPLTVTVGN